MRDLKIVTGTANVELAKLIASYNQVPLVRALVDHFPDGETQVRIEENVRGSDLFIIQPTCPPANDDLMELPAAAGRRQAVERAADHGRPAGV